MTDFFIADLHFGSPDQSYAKSRGFTSSEAMQEMIASGWQARVTDRDTVWVLGNVGDYEPLRDLPGAKRLIFGDQDDREAAFESGVFITRAPSHMLHTEQGSILLIHDPLASRFKDVRVLYGGTGPDEPDDRSMSVSVDEIGWAPVSLPEVLERFAARAANS